MFQVPAPASLTGQFLTRNTTLEHSRDMERTMGNESSGSGACDGSVESEPSPVLEILLAPQVIGEVGTVGASARFSNQSTEILLKKSLGCRAWTAAE